MTEAVGRRRVSMYVSPLTMKVERNELNSVYKPLHFYYVISYITAVEETVIKNQKQKEN